MDGTGLAEDLFVRLAARIAEVSGIRLPATKRWLLAARVAERQQETGHRDARAYVRAVVDDDDAIELGRLVEAVRVGETHFFRHQGQLRAIRRVALPQIEARHQRDGARGIRVWSAGCASGEEAYTLAMLLEDALPRERGWSHEVFATDLSDAALAVAREGRYPQSSAREVPPEIARWALVQEGDEVRVTARARLGVHFERRNLLDARYPHDFDLVLCRNVLIYFDRATQDDVVRRLVRSVLPGGYLALGYTEHVREAEAANLLPLRTEDGILYQRAEPGAAPSKALLSEAQAAAKRSPARRTEARVTASHVAAARAPIAATPHSEPARTASAAPGAAGSKVSVVRTAPSAARSNTEAPLRREAADVRVAPVMSLSGELTGADGCATARSALTSLLSARGDAVLDLRTLRFADEDVARLLARAAETLHAEGRALRVRSGAPGIERFLRRHGIVPPAVLLDDTEEVA